MKAPALLSASLLALLSLTLLGGCASMSRPTAESMEKLPIVTYPDSPGSNKDFVFKLPAGKPIATLVSIQGNALATGAHDNLSVTLPHDIYIYQHWISEDLKTWQRADKVLKVSLDLKLPSTEHPKPGELTLQIDRKAP